MAMIIFGTAVVVINTVAAVVNIKLGNPGNIAIGLINAAMVVFVTYIVAKDLLKK